MYKRLLISLLCSFTLVPFIYGIKLRTEDLKDIQVNDSIKNIIQNFQVDSIHQLKEIVITNNNIVRDGNVIRSYPTKRDRRFAFGATDVLANMQLPEIIINPLNNEVSSSDGESITMFIDFQPASNLQLNNVRPQDIQRIDIIRSPSDPRFNGAKVAANFILKKYEYGGYTKFGINQFIPVYSGKYDLYSKFSYKRMTYDMSGSFNYKNNNNSSGISDFSLYRFSDIEIDRRFETDEFKKRLLSPKISIRGLYSSPNISISNILNYNYLKLNPSEYFGFVSFDDTMDSYSNYSTNSHYSRNIIWNGNYYFQLRHNWKLSFDGKFDYGYNNDNSMYQLSTHTPIINNISETIINTYGSFTLFKQFRKFKLDLYGSGGWNRNILKYISSKNSDIYYREGYGQIGARAVFDIKNFSISPSFRISLSSEKIGITDFIRFYPKFFIPYYLQLTKKSSLNGNLEFALGSPSGDLRNPVLVKSNELYAVRGNENLTNYQFYKAQIGYSHYWGNWLSSRIDANFNCNSNAFIPIYNPDYTLETSPIMIQDVINNGYICNTSIRLSLSGKYFGNKLIVNVNGSLNHFSQHGIYKRSKLYPYFWLSTSYYLNNVKISSYFTPESWAYSAWGDIKTPMYWYIGAAYSYSNFYIDLRFSNPFVKSYKEQFKRIDTPNYALFRTDYSPTYHQSIKISLSYSFGYGKKLSSNNEISNLEGGQSIILKER